MEIEWVNGDIVDVPAEAIVCPTRSDFVYHGPGVEAAVYQAAGEEDLVHTLAHELRHVWQELKHPEIYYKNYKEAGFSSYDLQPEEIDAEAFASVYIEKYYNIADPIRFCYRGWNLNIPITQDPTYDKIAERMDYIKLNWDKCCS